MLDGEAEYFRQQTKDLLEYFNIPTPYHRPQSDWHESDPTKILVISDPHEPWGDERVYSEAMRHKDAGTLVVPGDLGDYYSKSRFKKTKHVSFADEGRAVFLRMQWFATHWKRVLIMQGNHDDRPEKQIVDLLPSDLLIMTERNLLKRFATFFDNVEIVGQQLDGSPKILTHIFQLGDIVFTHGELSRAQKTSVMEYISRHLYRWSEDYGLKPYCVIAQGHNHSALYTADGREYWFMLPAACDRYALGMEYVYTARMVGQPMKTGYTIFYQENGVTDVNRSQIYLV